MTTAEMIYRGATADSLGLSTTAYVSRKETLDRYLAQSDGQFSEEDYLRWLSQDESGSAGNQKEMPSTLEKAKNLAVSAKAWVKEGCRFVDELEHLRRMATCRNCNKFVDEKRCAVCGCFMNFKSRLAGMKCPEGKW